MMTRRRQLLDMHVAESQRQEHANAHARRSIRAVLKTLEKQLAAIDADIDRHVEGGHGGLGLLQDRPHGARVGVRAARGVQAQAAQPLGCLAVTATHLGGEHRRIEGQGADAHLLGKSGVVASIAFVGGDEVGLSARGVGGDAVRLVHAKHRPVANVDGIVAVGGVDTVTREAMILVAQRHHVSHRGAIDRHDRKGIVLLQRDRGHAVVSTPDSGGLLGLINANGDIVIEPVWSKLDWFLGKYFLVSDGEALGLIDNQGNTIIELYYPTREEDAEIEKARGSIRSHPFVRMLGEQLKEKIAAIAPGGSLAPLTGVLSASWAGDIELTAAGLWGRKVELMADYRPEYMGRPIEAGSTGSISFYYPVTASIFDLSKEAPVLGLSILPHASIGVPWELLRFASEPVSTTVTSSPDTP